MAGLGLQDALGSLQQGIAWRQDQDARAKEQKRQQVMDAANKAAADVLTASQEEAARNGQDISKWRPSDTLMMRQAEARGQVFAKAGDWENYLRNEASVQGQRIRVRSNALQKFEQDGDDVALVRTAYPTVFDGMEIVGVEKLPGGPADAPKGAPSGPPKLRITTRGQDGKEVTNMVDPANVVQRIKMSLVDPQAAAQKEIELNFLRQKVAVETGGKVKVEEVKGDQDRKTEAQKAEERRVEGVAEFGRRLTLADADHKSGEKRASIAAAASRYTADKGLEAATIRSADGDKPKRMSPKELQEMIERSYGTAASQSSWDNKRVGNETTAAILEGAQAYMRQYPQASESEAINAAAKRMGLKASPVAK